MIVGNALEIECSAKNWNVLITPLYAEPMLHSIVTTKDDGTGHCLEVANFGLNLEQDTTKYLKV